MIAYELEGLNTLFNEAVDSDERFTQIRFTTEKGWLDVDRRFSESEYEALSTVISEGTFPTEEIQSGYFFDDSRNVLLVYLSLSEEPITGFDTEIHEGKFITTFPVMQILVGPAININFENFKSKKFDSMSS